MIFLTKNNFPDQEFSQILQKPFINKELIIGIDCGKCVCNMASRFRENIYIGVEIKKHQSQVAYYKAEEMGLYNVIIVNMEALDFIENHIKDRTLQVIHIYFPTPYPNALGLKSKLMSRAFVDEAYRVIQPGGSLRFVTDHKKYFNETSRCFDFNRWCAIDWEPLALGQKDGYYVGTNCEVSFREFHQSDIYAFQLIRQ